MRDRHGKSDRDRGVHRVAACFKNGDADVSGNRLHGHHHAVPRAQRLTRGVQRDGNDKAEQKRQRSSHPGIVLTIEQSIRLVPGVFFVVFVFSCLSWSTDRLASLTR